MSSSLRAHRRPGVHLSEKVSQVADQMSSTAGPAAPSEAGLAVFVNVMSTASATASVVAVLSDLYLCACKKYDWLPFARVMDRRVPKFAYFVASVCSIIASIASIISDPKPAWATLVLAGVLVLGHFVSDTRR